MPKFARRWTFSSSCWNSSTGGDDEIVFFADEGGSWQVGINNGKVLPAYFTSLAAVAEPETYAARVTEIIDEHASYESDKFLKVARKVADAAQRSALTKR